LNRFRRDVNGVFCPNETAAIGMTKALRDLGLAGGKVKMIGFDSGTQSVQDLKSGDLQGLVVQNPMRMGYLGVMTMVKHLQGEPVEKRIDTGVVLATSANMEQPEIKALLRPPVDEYLK
jgi:ribose transport system substrate-binding protein